MGYNSGEIIGPKGYFITKTSLYGLGAALAILSLITFVLAIYLFKTINEATILDIRGYSTIVIESNMIMLLFLLVIFLVMVIMISGFVWIMYGSMANGVGHPTGKRELYSSSTQNGAVFLAKINIEERCPECGFSLGFSGSKYCPECGHGLNKPVSKSGNSEFDSGF